MSRGPLSGAALLALGCCAALLFAGFTALGVWQLQRRVWKLELIERVAQRVHAPSQPAPGPGRWDRINAADDEYRRVRISGRWLHDKTVRVQALSELGAGFWVLTPLRGDDGTLVLVNRGFVPPGQALLPAADEAGVVTVTGLLRLSEPGGGFLRRNDPAAGRWTSRDVQAIAASQRLPGPVAPYFIDAEAAPDVAAATAWPRPGLTVISFRNDHLVYALTWFALAAMVAVAAWMLLRSERRLRQELPFPQGERGLG